MPTYQYQNTRDILGDDATLAGLVMNTLTEFVEDGVTSVVSWAFSRRNNLQMVRLPKLTQLASNMFNECTNIKHLILDHEGVVTGYSRANLPPLIGVGEGALYVPEDQVSNYKNNSSWKLSGITIAPIDDYPLTVFDSIKDDWDTILSSDGSAYSIGDTKTMSLTDGSVYKMQIVYKGEGGSILTWLGKNIRENQKMNVATTSLGGWEGCELRTYIRGDGFYNLIPTNIKNHIVAVDKTYCDYTTGSKVVKSCSDTVWIPSNHEVNNDNAYENSGVAYNMVFPVNDKSTRIKYLNGSAGNWWLRSAYGSTHFRYVSSGGNISDYNASGSYGLVLGFCTGN